MSYRIFDDEGNLIGSISMCFGTLQYPIDSRLHCRFIDCYAGSGLAGNGQCFARGMWWHHSCPMYQYEDDFLAEWEQREEADHGK